MVLVAAVLLAVLFVAPGAGRGEVVPTAATPAGAAVAPAKVAVAPSTVWPRPAPQRPAWASLPDRAPGEPLRIVALGDSVAAGHGIDRGDLLGADPCWRAESAGYPARLAAALAPDAPAHDRGTPQLTVLACASARVGDLLGDGGQLDAAVALDPDVVTVTIGANDLGFVDPGRLLGPDGTVDTEEVRATLDGLGRDLRRVLWRLVAGTDAVVLVTTYHDPTAEDPWGVEGCRGDCFAAVAEQVVAELNGTVAGATRPFGADRVRVADVAPRFEGHGAPDGLGIDLWRAEGLPSWIPAPEPLKDVFSLASGVQPYCARSDGPGPSFVTGIDCVHPNAEGAQAYADALAEAFAQGSATSSPGS